MSNFYLTVAMYSHMLLLTEKVLINITHLDSHSPFKVVLKDGTVLKSSPFAEKRIKRALLDYQAELLLGSDSTQETL
jgi:hypothetical protein